MLKVMSVAYFATFSASQTIHHWWPNRYIRKYLKSRNHCRIIEEFAWRNCAKTQEASARVTGVPNEKRTGNLSNASLACHCYTGLPSETKFNFLLWLNGILVEEREGEDDELIRPRNIKFKLIFNRNKMDVYGQDSPSSGQRPVEGPCKHCNGGMWLGEQLPIYQ